MIELFNTSVNSYKSLSQTDRVSKLQVNCYVNKTEIHIQQTTMYINLQHWCSHRKNNLKNRELKLPFDVEAIDQDKLPIVILSTPAATAMDGDNC